MIKSFKNKRLEKFYLKEDKSGIKTDHIEKIKIILNDIDSATNINQLNLPPYNLHKLKGNMKNLYSITIKANWRITFEFIDGDAYILDYIDYH